MGYLNNSTVSIDAILTTKGRELLAKGSANGLDIKYFALGDDEVNYDLWNPAHPLGSDYYGIIIENMPVLEASPIPEQNLRSKLISLPKGTTSLKTITTNASSIGTSTAPLLYDINGVKQANTPFNFPINLGLSSEGSGNNNTLGYSVIYDPRYFGVIAGATPPGFSGINVNNTNQSNATLFGDALSSTLVSTITAGTFTISLPPNISVLPIGNSIQNIIIQGNEVGGTLTIPVYFRRGNVSGGSSQ